MEVINSILRGEGLVNINYMQCFVLWKPLYNNHYHMAWLFIWLVLAKGANSAAAQMVTDNENQGLMWCIWCSHSQANGDQGDFELTYAACPVFPRHIFTIKFWPPKISVSPWGPPPLPYVQYIDPEVPLVLRHLMSRVWFQAEVCWFAKTWS